MMRRAHLAVLFSCFVTFALPYAAFAAPIISSDSGTAADILDTVNAFRAALGDPNNANAPGPLAAGRREINWDGGGATTNATAGTPFNGFRNTRGAQFITLGTGFVQGPPDAAAPDQGLADLFNNPTYGAIFSTFSPLRLFVPIDSNVTEALFFIPGTNGAVPASVRGFGAVFTSVDLAGMTTIEIFDITGALITSAPAPIGGLSFLGVRLTPGSTPIGRVRITTGTTALGPNDNPAGGVDVAAMDDFIYAEPQVVPEPATLLLLGAGLVGFALTASIRRRKRKSSPHLS